MKRLMLIVAIGSLSYADEKVDHPTGPRITPPTVNVVSPRGVARGTTVEMTVEESQSAFTRAYRKGEHVRFPVAHGEGNYYADEETLDRLEGENRVAFRYLVNENPNGAARNIAGILNEKRNVLGLMPHPESFIDPTQHPRWTREPRREVGDGLRVFQNAVQFFQ